ncbi:DUF3046 domain-containing protein [Microbacterium laevaniformans]|uniref:DUF3046 domain-containing protein n=1 Tax=Microbacterium TaxID=33882 RepID=UPI0002D86E0F|nr:MULTISPECIES: DUF3046 domain-containing protein [Microbacterium]MBM7751996.1 hypothetical protein [Microbacterium laevaniformans]OJU46744.1 MAG: hypothetical protein BGN98_05785 [Microbacterium sp. 69-7]RKS88384.1 DUF3046 family protein [Microbacterium sp. AG790]GLJ65098.1 hypothetical protein GCM10017578_19870 [Microbacterium laevaniformans]
MRRSEFTRAVEDEFGNRAAMLVADLALPGVGHRTAAEALADGVEPREIWFALCDETDVPASRRHGVGLMEPRRR